MVPYSQTADRRLFPLSASDSRGRRAATHAAALRTHATWHGARLQDTTSCTAAKRRPHLGRSASLSRRPGALARRRRSMAEDEGAEKSIEMWKIKRARPRAAAPAALPPFARAAWPSLSPPRPAPALTDARRVPHRS